MKQVITILFLFLASCTTTLEKPTGEHMSLRITSPSFENNAMIPMKYTCEGERTTNPPLAFADIPVETKSLALLMDDPDVPTQLKPDGVFDHWVLFNIPPKTKEIPEGQTAGIPGTNGRGEAGYTGPCPPKEYEPSQHRYFFKLYALDTELSLAKGALKADVVNAMRGHIIEQATLIGVYKKK